MRHLRGVGRQGDYGPVVRGAHERGMGVLEVGKFRAAETDAALHLGIDQSHVPMRFQCGSGRIRQRKDIAPGGIRHAVAEGNEHRLGGTEVQMQGISLRIKGIAHAFIGIVEQRLREW